MVTNITPNQNLPAAFAPDWEPPPPPTDLIFDDGEPLETYRHRTAMNALIRSLNHVWLDRTDYFAGGNMFIYYSANQALNRDFRGPDFFAVLNIDGTHSRQGWVVWQEEGRYPDVIVELMSPSTRKIDTGIKKNLYAETFKTRNYFVFDPFDPHSLQGWQLDEHFRYQPLTANPQGWLWSEVLGFWLGTWEGTVEKETTCWLRFYDEHQNLVLLPEEAAQQHAEAERQKAEAAQQHAEAERQKAEAAQQHAEAERQKAETAQQHAEAERQRADRLAARLRELGENPENF